MAVFKLSSTIPLIPSDLGVYLQQMFQIFSQYGQLGPNGVTATIPPLIKANLNGTGLEYELASMSVPKFTHGTLTSASFSYIGLIGLRATDLNISAAAFTAAYTVSPANGIALLLSKSDTIFGTGFGDNIEAGKGNDKAYGGAGNDTLLGYFQTEGSDGKDSLFGGTGGDAVVGGSGDDLLSGGGGLDTVIGGTGNDRLYGGIGLDSVIGGDGNDRLYGGGSFDTVYGDNGNDQIFGGAGFNYMSGGTGNDKIVGGNDDDTISGDDGNDRITGNGGADVLTGGNNNDQFSGGNGNDYIGGDGGNDTIRGGLGNDTLGGGSGADKFIFDTALTVGNIDQISDFSVVEDLIYLDKSVFKALAGLGALSGAQFHIGSSAADASDRIIYDSSNGHLSYDADGAGGKAAVFFALLSTGLALDGGDFRLIA